MSEPVVIKVGVALCAHGFPLSLKAAKTVLKVNNEPVLLHGDFPGTEVTACTANPKCTMVAERPPTTGKSTVLTVGGDPVALASASGPTDAPSTFKVQDAGQRVLKAK